jgi:hypothetical protein
MADCLYKQYDRLDIYIFKQQATELFTLVSNGFPQYVVTLCNDSFKPYSTAIVQAGSLRSGSQHWFQQVA